MQILIVKHGALGDVVRTSYFAEALRSKFGARLRLSWVTAKASRELLQHNPAINDLWTDFAATEGRYFDHVFSLDDESEVIDRVMNVKAAMVTGAIKKDGVYTYTLDAAAWFDMGLLSRFGKQKADELKKANRKSHAEIFSAIFGVDKVQPSFFGAEAYRDQAAALSGDAAPIIGINPYAGSRWPSKGLETAEVRELVFTLLEDVIGRHGRIVLTGSGEERARNVELVRAIGDPRLVAPDTSASILCFAAIVAELDYLITADSLALHLAVAQRVPFLAFFAPTSAVEIDDFGTGVKLCSLSPDYCSYRKDADNRSLTADRILDLMRVHRPRLFRPSHLRVVGQ